MIERIASTKRTREILEKYSFVFQKKFGQNFLLDLNILDYIVSSSEITNEDMVIEIGPGIGSLTQELAENAREVICIEIDKKLIPILEDTICSHYDNVTLINEDVLKVDINQLVQERNNGKPVKVVANLPYYITTPIIMGLFENNVPVESITVMVQKEVADRMQAKPSTKDYGALSLAVQYYCRPEIVTLVSPECFTPKPNVGSAVIKLTAHKEKPVQVKDEKLLFKLIKATFKQRRKTLAKSLNNQLGYDKKMIADLLTELEFGPMVRGEALNLEQFGMLTNTLYNKLNK